MAPRNAPSALSSDKLPGEDALGRVGRLHTRAQSKGYLFAELLGQNSSGILSKARATNLNSRFRSIQPRGGGGSSPARTRCQQASHPTSCPARSG